MREVEVNIAVKWVTDGEYLRQAAQEEMSICFMSLSYIYRIYSTDTELGLLTFPQNVSKAIMYFTASKFNGIFSVIILKLPPTVVFSLTTSTRLFSSDLCAC